MYTHHQVHLANAAVNFRAMVCFPSKLLSCTFTLTLVLFCTFYSGSICQGNSLNLSIPKAEGWNIYLQFMNWKMAVHRRNSEHFVMDFSLLGAYELQNPCPKYGAHYLISNFPCFYHMNVQFFWYSFKQYKYSVFNDTPWHSSVYILPTQTWWDLHF